MMRYGHRVSAGTGLTNGTVSFREVQVLRSAFEGPLNPPLLLCRGSAAVAVKAAHSKVAEWYTRRNKGGAAGVVLPWYMG